MTPFQALGEKLSTYKRFPRAMVQELFGVTPDPWQSDVLDMFPRCPRISLQSCTGSGKTASLAWIAWNYLLCRVDPMIGAVAVSRTNLDANLGPELARWYQKSDLLQALFEIVGDDIRLKERPATWVLKKRAWRQDADATQIGNALRGLHAKYVMWLSDEMGAAPEAVLPTMEAIFSGDPEEAHIVLAGNPTHLSGPLWQASKNRQDWLVVEITADPDDPKRTPRVSKEHASQQIRTWGRDNSWVIVNIFGRFPPASLNALIGIEEVEAAMKRQWSLDQIGDAPKIIGADVARFGDDASALVFRHGMQVTKIIRRRGLNSTQGAALVNREWDEFGADAVFVDDTAGFGGGWIDNLQRLGRDPIGVCFSAKAHDEGYANKRAEMYFDTVKWIKAGGALPNSPQMARGLTATTYTFQKNSGRLILEDKGLIKAKIGYSPDETDALVLTHAEPVAKRTAIIRRPYKFVEEQWNPFAEKPAPSNDGGYNPYR